MPDLIKQIYIWSNEGHESVEVSIIDLLLMANHIADLELELFTPLCILKEKSNDE